VQPAFVVRKQSLAGHHSQQGRLQVLCALHLQPRLVVVCPAIDGCSARATAAAICKCQTVGISDASAFGERILIPDPDMRILLACASNLGHICLRQTGGGTGVPMLQAHVYTRACDVLLRMSACYSMFDIIVNWVGNHNSIANLCIYLSHSQLFVVVLYQRFCSAWWSWFL
jgi:hypothetical protein